MHRRNAAQFRIDLRNKRAQLQLRGELSGVEISYRAGLNFAGIDLGVVDRLFPGFRDQMPDRLAFLFKIAFKIGAPAAEDVDFVHNVINLADLHALSSRTQGPDNYTNESVFFC